MTSGSQGGIIINSTDTSSNSYGRLLFTPNGHLSGNEGLIRYNNSDYHMAFYTQGAERLRIDRCVWKYGRLLGTQSPSANLDVVGTDATIRVATDINTDGAFVRVCETDFQGGYLKYDGANNLLHIGTHDLADENTANDADRITIERTSGNIDINNTSPSYLLDAKYQTDRMFHSLGDLRVHMLDITTTQ